MTEKPLVSVLMTVYNREKFIAEAIKSVLVSTYTNFELIIVDDKSNDNSVAIAKEFEQQDNRIRFYINEKNLGDYPNRNKAASYAKGKYLKYVDADDLIYPYGLEQLVFYMEQFPEAGYGLCSFERVIENKYPFQLEPKEAYKSHYFKMSLFHRAPLSSIIKKSAFEKVNGFSGKQHVGDFEIWHLLSKEYPVVLMPRGIVWYRVHDDQQMTANRTDPFVPFKYLLLAESIIKNKDTPLDSVEKEVILNELERKKARSVISAFKQSSLRKAMELYKASNLSFIDIITANFRIIKEKLF